MLVYICSPFRGETGSKAEMDANVAVALEACRKAVAKGFTPIAPHLFFPRFLDDCDPVERDQGIQAGLDILSSCEELWVIGKTRSSGMQAEIREAIRMGKPIIQFINDSHLLKMRDLKDRERRAISKADTIAALNNLKRLVVAQPEGLYYGKV